MKCYNSSSSNSLPKKGGGGSGGSVESAVCFLGLKQLFFKVMVAAMGCVFSCFRVKDSTHNRSSSPFSTPPNASVRSSSSSFLFLCFGFCLVMFLMSLCFWFSEQETVPSRRRKALSSLLQSEGRFSSRFYFWSSFLELRWLKFFFFIFLGRMILECLRKWSQK